MTPMRFQGKIKTWDDERGFGFIEPRGGGEAIPVHIVNCLMGSYRPKVGQHVSFEVETGPSGDKSACKVEPACAAIPHVPRIHRQPSRWSRATLLAIPGFLLLHWLVSLVWRSPPWLLVFYLAVSITTYGVYRLDKSATQVGGKRMPERILHLLSLLGGWPGALIAQQFGRHKSNRARFRRVFWGTVVVNSLAFLLICSPLVQPLWTTS